MSNPIVADNKPIVVTLEVGTEYHWCACGRSTSQPFCDGSHRGTGIEPLEFTADTNEETVLCQCKGTRDRPFCDGSHMRIDKGQVK